MLPWGQGHTRASQDSDEVSEKTGHHFTGGPQQLGNRRLVISKKEGKTQIGGYPSFQETGDRDTADGSRPRSQEGRRAVAFCSRQSRTRRCRPPVHRVSALQATGRGVARALLGAPGGDVEAPIGRHRENRFRAHPRLAAQPVLPVPVPLSEIERGTGPCPKANNRHLPQVPSLRSPSVTTQGKSPLLLKRWGWVEPCPDNLPFFRSTDANPFAVQGDR